MSRWTDFYKEHAFNSSWEVLNSLLDEAQVDDVSIVASVEELARLKRVVGCLNGLMDSLDPELVPMSTWDSFNSQLSPCVSEVRNFNSNRNIAHIRRANSHADNLISYVRPYMAIAGRTARGMRDSAMAYSEAMAQGLEGFQERARVLLEDISKYKEQSFSIRSGMEDILSRINAVDKDLNGDGDGEGRSALIVSMADDVLSKYNSISNYYAEISSGIDGKESIKDAVSRFLVEIKGDAKLVREASAGSTAIRRELEDFEVRMLGSKDDSGERVGGVEEDLARLKSDLLNFQDSQRKKYSALNEQIEGLLPGAASAGLASAYGKMKDSFCSPIKLYTNIFYVSISLLVLVSVFFSVEKVYWFGFDLVDAGSWEAIVRNLLSRLPLAAPLVWLAYFASKRRSEYQRLEQEYAHKEALAQSYDSYKRQVDEIGGENGEMLMMLIKKAVEAVSFNASSTLDGRHGDNMPAQDVIISLLDKLQPAGKSG